MEVNILTLRQRYNFFMNSTTNCGFQSQITVLESPWSLQTLCRKDCAAPNAIMVMCVGIEWPLFFAESITTITALSLEAP